MGEREWGVDSDEEIEGYAYFYFYCLKLILSYLLCYVLFVAVARCI